MKLTKETLKRIIKEELEGLTLEAGFRPISPEEQEAQDSQQAKEGEEEENEIIRSVIGSGRKLANEMSKEFEKAYKGGDSRDFNEEQIAIQKKYFHNNHAIRTMYNWYSETLQGKISYTRKKQVLSFLNPNDGGKLSAVWNDLLDLGKDQTPLYNITSKAFKHRSEGRARSYPGIDG